VVVGRGGDLHREQVEAAVAHPGTGDHGVGEGADLGGGPFQDHALQTVVVVEVDMQGGAGEVVGTEAAAPAPVELTPEEKAAIARQQAAARKRAEARQKQQREAERALARKRARLPLNSQTPFMGQGYVVTLGNKIKAAGQAWWKTTRGGFVQANRTRPRATTRSARRRCRRRAATRPTAATTATAATA
jgi:hypothetical protein